MNEIIEMFKLMADNTRLRIITLLAQEQLCVCQICGILDISQPKASKHLARLRDRGLVVSERKEQFMFYKLQIDNETIQDIVSIIVKDIDFIEQLKIDKKNLLQKDNYFSKCKTNKELF